MSKHRVVVTGMGAVTPVGLDLEETWSALVAGRSGVRPVTSFDASDFPTTIAAEVLGFDPQNYMDFKSARRTARFTQFAVACTQEAIKNAGLDLSREDRERVGMAMGTAIGGITIIEEQSVIFHEKGYRRVNPALIPLLLASSSACHLAIELGIKGPTTSPVAACATGVVAVGDALRLLQHGLADVVIAGGTEAAISPLGLSAFSRVGVLSSNNVEPERACRPFDAKRDGTVMGEGAAALILETLEHAERRGANIIAEVVGYGLSEDAYHIAAPDPSGKGAARAMSLAMADAGLAAEELHYIAPHGTGTALNDVSETCGCKAAFGTQAYRIPISSNKSMLGHLLGAAGAVSAAVAVLTIRDNILPPTLNLENPDPDCDLDFVPGVARRAEVDASMANAFGFGGQNASVVFKRYHP